MLAAERQAAYKAYLTAEDYDRDEESAGRAIRRAVEKLKQKQNVQRTTDMMLQDLARRFERERQKEEK